MSEMRVTATDFRRCIAQIKNAVAYRQDRVVMTLHGRPVAVLVSMEEYEYLGEHRPEPIEPIPDFPPGIRLHVEKAPLPKKKLPDPWKMPLEEVKVLYAAHKDPIPSDPDLLDWVCRA